LAQVVSEESILVTPHFLKPGEPAGLDGLKIEETGPVFYQLNAEFIEQAIEQ
jgi:hypothetical protein